MEDQTVENILKSIGDPAHEHALGRQGVALAERSGEGWIRARGPDAVAYLHNLTSNDVEALADGEGQHSLYLTGNGKVLSELYVYRVSGDELYLEVPAAGAAGL